MTFAQAIKTCLRKYFTFSGRASRSEYWWFVLFGFLASLVAGFVDFLLFGTGTITTAPGEIAVESEGPLGGLVALALFIPALSAGWRRMHDSGRSGFYLLYPLIVMVGITTAASVFGGLNMITDGTAQGLAAIVLIPAMIILAISPLLVLWWLTRPSQPGPNEYGPEPNSDPRSNEVQK